MEECSDKKETNILNNKNIIFEHEDIIKGIESIFSFKDGDFLVLKNTFSLLYDGKTFQIKLELGFLGALCAFCYISEDEFIVIKDYLLTLYKFKNNRTACDEISIIHENYLHEEQNKKLFKLSNNDLLNITQNLLYPKKYRIFRRIEENNIFKK